MRLLLIGNGHVAVYEGRKRIAVYQVLEQTDNIAAELEKLRTSIAEAAAQAS